MSTLEVRSLSRIRDGVLVLDEVSFTVPDGEVAAVAGPAFAGKTSLIRIIAGVESSDGGDVLVDGQSLLRLAPEARGIGVMFDDLALFEDMTVRENVAFGLRMQRRKRVDRARRADLVLEATGLSGRAHRRPADLTPSERKRLAFARAIAPEPSLLLLDDPTAGVEEVLRDSWREELGQMLRALRVTTLITTDDMRDAVMLAGHLVLMTEGQVLQSGTTSRVLQAPASVEAAALAGYAPLVRGEVADGMIVEPGVGSIAFPAEFPLRQRAVAMAHRAALFGVPGGSGLGSGVSGTAGRARPDGPAYTVEVRLNDRTLELRWEWDLTPPAAGEAVEVAVRPGTLRFFNETATPRIRMTEGPPRDPARFAVFMPQVAAGEGVETDDQSDPAGASPPAVEPRPAGQQAAAAASPQESSEPDAAPARRRWTSPPAEPASPPSSQSRSRGETDPASPPSPPSPPSRPRDAAPDAREGNDVPPGADSRRAETGAAPSPRLPRDEGGAEQPPPGAPTPPPPAKAGERHTGMPLD